MRDKFNALRFTAAECWTGLPKLQVSEAGIAERLEWPLDLWKAGEELRGFLDTHLQHLGDVLRLIKHVQRLAVESRSFASFAAHIGRRQKVHFQLDSPGAFTFRTTALSAVKGETAGRITAQPRFRSFREKLPDFVEEAHVGRGC